MKHTITVAGALCVIALACTGCESDKKESAEKQQTTQQNNEIANTENPTIDRMLMLQLVNQQRAKGAQCGEYTYQPIHKKLTWSNTLERVAKKHSNDMNQNAFFSHTGSDQSEAHERMNQLGYFWLRAAENIAKGYKSEADVLEGWMKSTGHCKNIMMLGLEEMGVAKTGIYWTQVFGTPR